MNMKLTVMWALLLAMFHAFASGSQCVSVGMDDFWHEDEYTAIKRGQAIRLTYDSEKLKPFEYEESFNVIARYYDVSGECHETVLLSTECPAAGELEWFVPKSATLSEKPEGWDDYIDSLQLIVCNDKDLWNSSVRLVKNFNICEADVDVSVEEVSFWQRYPWNGLVDIYCRVTCPDPSAEVKLFVAARDIAANKELVVRNIWLDGDYSHSKALTVKGGGVNDYTIHHLVWDAGKDNPNFVGDSVMVEVQAFLGTAHYMVVDLSDGADAAKYPVSYLDIPPQGGWTDEYKTEKLVLRRIPAGSFNMGCDESEIGYAGQEAVPHEVTISKPFYIGVFEVTQKQYELVTGMTPSNYKGDARPLDAVAWTTIRGGGVTYDPKYDWPNSSDVDDAKFMGKLRAKTGITSFDLPTEAKWEYACRAGTTTALNSGKNLTSTTSDVNMDEVGRYKSNQSDGKGGCATGHTMVGSYLPNAWGLYDMHGNVLEWTLDGYQPRNEFDWSLVVDPVGSTSSWARVLRGGYNGSEASGCRSASRWVTGEPYCVWSGAYGFRISCLESESVAESGGASEFSAKMSAAGRLDLREGTRLARSEEYIQYDPSWGNADTCTIEGIEDSPFMYAYGGTITWTPPKDVDVYTLTHTAGNLTYVARFAVLGDDVIQHSGVLVSNEIWTVEKPHLVTSNFTVPSALSVTIESGAVVKFMPGVSFTVMNGGSCTAQGVIFTHVNDDTVGGDTLCDGDSTIGRIGDYIITGKITDDDSTEYRYMKPNQQTLVGDFPLNAVLRGDCTYIVPNTITVQGSNTLTIQPGAILKFAKGCSLRVEGKLIAQGTRAKQIIFTSINDDTNGGDANEDGATSLPCLGDWGGVVVLRGEINAKYAQFLYGGGDTPDMPTAARASCYMFNNASGTFDCCKFAGSPMDGCFAQNAQFTNCIFEDCDRGLASSGGKVEAFNCVAANNRIGFFAHVTPIIMQNCISSLNTEYAISGDGSVCQTFSCYLGGDPKFLDPYNGDYRIAADSPCVDAGDVAYAPTKDYYGSPRYAMTYGGEAKPDIGIYEVLPKRVGSEVDLEAVEVSVVGDSFTVGDEVTVKWKVRNVGSATAQGPWTDTISVIDVSGAVVALGSHTMQRNLAPGATADCEERFRLPAMAEGLARLRLTVNSGRDVFEGTLTANNTISSATTFAVALPVFEPGAGSFFQIPSGSSVAFTFPADSGATVLLVSGGANISVFGASGYVPRHNHSDVEAVRLDGGSLAGLLMLTIPKDTAENGFVVSIANSGTSVESVTIATETRSLAIAEVSPSRLAVGSSGALLIRGIGMENVAAIRLEGNGGARLVATEITRLSFSEIAATFNLSGVTLGTYSVTVEDADGHTNRLANAVEIYKPIEGPKLEAHLELPSAVRRGRITTGRIVYFNTGDQPMRAPYFMISADNAQFRMDGEEEWQQGYIEVMGLGDGVKPGTLEPGERGSVTFEFISLGGIAFRLESDDDSSVYWAEYADSAASAANRMNQRGRRVVRYTELERHAEEFRNHPETSNAACGVLSDRASGEPLAGVEVCAMSADGELLSSDTVDANGVFVLEGLPNATNLVLSVVEGAFADDLPVAMPASGDLLGLKWYGTKGWTINVYVNGATAEDFAEGIEIDIMRLGEDSKTTYLTLTNAVEGVASVTVRESGIYIIRAKTNGGSEQFALVECEAGAAVAEAVVDFAAGHSVSGVVADLDGNGLSGALLSLSPKGEMNGYARTVNSDENGSFTFGCIEDGEYLLSWTKNGYGSDVAVDVSVNGGDVAGLSLRCMAFAQSISGKVNAECAGMTAAFATSAGGSVTAAIADDGTFTLEGLPEGRGTFSVMDGSGNIIYMMRDLYVRPGANTLDVTAETELCNVVGVTVDAKGNPVQAVWLFTSTSGDGGAGYANENGKCLTKLRKATYDVSIAADGFVTRKFRRKITDSCKLTATLERGGCAKVAPDADACLVAFSADGIVDDGVEASDDGTVLGAYTNGTEVTAFVVCLDKAYRTDSIAITAGTTGTLSRVEGGRALTITAIGNKADVAAFRLALADGSGFVATWPVGGTSSSSSAECKLELTEFPAVAAVVSAVSPDGSIISSANVAANATSVEVSTSATLPIVGYIVDDAPAMLAGGAVSFGKEDGTILATAEVTPFGTFRADYVSDEYERVWVHLPNGLVFSVSRAEAANFAITPPDLDDTGLSQLKVVDENGDPVEGAEVDVETADGYETTLTTDRRGIVWIVTVVRDDPPKYDKPTTPSDPPKKKNKVNPKNPTSEPTPGQETKEPMERDDGDHDWICRTCRHYPCNCKVEEDGGEETKKDMQNRCPSCGQIEPCSCKDKGNKSEKKDDDKNENNPIKEEPVTEPDLEELTKDDIPDLDLPLEWDPWETWKEKYQEKIQELILRYEAVHKDADPRYPSCLVRNCPYNAKVWKWYREKKYDARVVYDLYVPYNSMLKTSEFVTQSFREFLFGFTPYGVGALWATYRKARLKADYLGVSKAKAVKDMLVSIFLNAICVKSVGACSRALKKSAMKEAKVSSSRLYSAILEQRIAKGDWSWNTVQGRQQIEKWHKTVRNHRYRVYNKNSKTRFSSFLDSCLDDGNVTLDNLMDAINILKYILEGTEEFEDQLEMLYDTIKDTELRIANAEKAAAEPYHKCKGDDPPPPGRKPHPPYPYTPPEPESQDPNEVAGPLGVGAARYVKAGAEMLYTVYFENKSDASAAAQDIYITNPLSEWFDWSTFEMGDVGFCNQSDHNLNGLKSGVSEVAQKGTGYYVQSSVVLDESAGRVKVELHIIDKTTKYGVPEDPYAGILPPNDDAHRGEGYITYRIKVRADAPNDVIIRNSATIVFDYNAPIETDPAWWNTVGVFHDIAIEIDGVTTNLTLIAGDLFGELPEPAARLGYMFDGWYTGENGTGLKAAPDAVVPDNSFSLHAHWIADGTGFQTIAEGGYVWAYRPTGDGGVCIVGRKDSNGAAESLISPKPNGRLAIPSKLGGRTVTGIGLGAFAGCDAMTEIVIPGTVTEIGDYAFYGCKALNGVSIPDSVKNIGIWSFAACTGISCVDIPGRVTNLGAYAFSNNRNLTNVVMHAGTESIQAAAFLNTGLFEIVIPDTVGVIGNCAFNYCYSLTNVVMGANVSAMGGMVFYKCTALESVVFRGNAPKLYWDYPLGVAEGDSNIYQATPTYLTTYVSRNSRGWNGTLDHLPEEWPVGDAYARKIVFNGDGSEQELKPKLVGTGKVTTPKTWKTGQKVTWKATADKGSVFARWEGPLVDSLDLAKNERRNPSLAFAVPEGFDTNQIKAVFIPIDDDGLYSLGITQTEFDLKETVSGVCVTDDSQSYVTATVSGLPTGLKFNAKTLQITGTPTKGGVYWVQIKAKNASGYQWAENVMVTVSGDGKEAKEPKLTRTAYYPLTVICVTEGGTAIGTGVYADGRKTTIKATPAKGCVFAGWYGKANSEEGVANSAGADYRSPSMSMVVPEMRYVFAKFATKEEDAASLALAVEDATAEKDGTLELDLGACVESLSLPKLSVAGLPSGIKYDAKTMTLAGKATKPGVYTVTVKATNASVARATGATTATFKITVPNFECAALPGLKPETGAYGTIHAGVKFGPGLIDCTPEDGWTVKAAGLPAGLKFAAKETKDATYGIVPAWTIYGVPTAKAGAYTVTFTASKKGEKNQVATITLNVEALPAWAVGTFTGAVFDESDAVVGQVQNITVSSAGKISGKIIYGDMTWTLSAPSFDEAASLKSEVGSPVFTATVIAKAGKEIVTNVVSVVAEAGTGVVYGGVDSVTAGAEAGPREWTAWRNVWKDAGRKEEAKTLKNLKIDPARGGTVTFSAPSTAGAVTAKLKDGKYSATMSTTLIPTDSGYTLFWYFPPKTGKFAGDGGCEEVK